VNYAHAEGRKTPTNKQDGLLVGVFLIDGKEKAAFQPL
tara:strand:+ start:4999 stop:5112 length:114 start_codon:yes stop_codon:yes gene_type:complete